MIVAGVMSGTSADGINVAFLRISGKNASMRFKLLAHEESPYPPSVRKKIIAVMNSPRASVADLAQLNFLLGELYADAVMAAQKQHSITKIDLAGCHGQTIYHQGKTEKYLGKSIAATWQTGEAAILAHRIGAPVVSDFRPSDMAAGGKGAPLVPLLDYLAYRHRSRGRILQNLGGIGNLSAIPANAKLEHVIAFDTGPANMVIDACMAKLYGRDFDKDGKVAASGAVLDTVLSEFLREPFFRQKPPKTAGREQFGREFVERFLRRCGRARREDVIATATALTARSIGLALQRYVLKSGAKYDDYILAGGGAKNPTLVKMIGEEIRPLGLKLKSSDDFGIPASAKEAIAFAVLAYQTWNHLPGNVPSATGAKRPVILGKVSYA